mgnify:FL=1
MLLHDTSFCFVCTHLTSGDKEGDELRRNADVAEILKRTRFPDSKEADTNVPKTIRAHEYVKSVLFSLFSFFLFDLDL